MTTLFFKLSKSICDANEIVNDELKTPAEFAGGYTAVTAGKGADAKCTVSPSRKLPPSLACALFEIVRS